MSALSCCSAPDHNEYVMEEGIAWKCKNCPAWWWDAEYQELVRAEAEEEKREAGWFEYGSGNKTREEYNQCRPKRLANFR